MITMKMMTEINIMVMKTNIFIFIFIYERDIREDDDNIQI